MIDTSENQIGALSPAAKADVREIVTEVVTTVMTTIVPGMIESVVSREIDKFAVMVKHGFDEIHEKMVTKDDLNEFRREIGIISDKTDSRLDDHEERLSYLEGVAA